MLSGSSWRAQHELSYQAEHDGSVGVGHIVLQVQVLQKNGKIGKSGFEKAAAGARMTNELDVIGILLDRRSDDGCWR